MDLGARIAAAFGEDAKSDDAARLLTEVDAAVKAAQAAQENPATPLQQAMPQ